MAAPVPGDLYPLIAAFLEKQGSTAAAAAVRADAKKKGGAHVKPPPGADLFAIYKAHVQQHGGCVWPWRWGQPPLFSDTVAQPLTWPLHCAQPDAPG
jgi:hypothetical protein